MAERVRYQVVSFATGINSSNTLYVGDHKHLLIDLPSPSSFLADTACTITIYGAPNSATTAKSLYYCNCEENTLVQLTASTEGIYECPYPGGIPYVKINFSTAVTQAFNLKIIYPSLYQ